MRKASDFLLIGSVLALMAFGIIMITSASLDVSGARYDNPLRMIRNWAFYIPVGCLVMWLVSRIDMQQLKPLSIPMLLAGIIMMIAVLLLGKEMNGATRWFSMFGVTFQPVEIFKPLMVLYVAYYIATFPERLRHFKQGMLPMLLVLGLGLVLLLAQPDFGNTMLLLTTVACMWFVGGIPLWHLLGIASLAVPGVGLLVYLEPYRMQRLTSFIDPWADQFGSGYQLIQSMLAFGSGGLYGTGLGQSVQKLFYLPEAWTDFIAAVIAEELGLPGIGLLIMLFAILIWRGFVICLRSNDMFERLMALGCTLLIGLSCIINLSVVMGLFPTKGMPLPFISYGGSALIGNCILVGILLGIERKQWQEAMPYTRQGSQRKAHV